MLTSARCAICRGPGRSPCAECAELFVPLGVVRPLPVGLDELFAAVAYADAAKPLVAGIKYRNQRSAIGWLAHAMVSAATPGPRPQVCTWAPTSAARRRERGFDQSELLARAVARRLGIPARRLLTRRGSPPQTGRSGFDRRHDAPAFVARRRTLSPSVLLVDDVVTTGATLAAAADALRRAGVLAVVGLVAAATPPPNRASR